MFFNKNEVFSGVQEKESIIYVRLGEKICPSRASIMMPIGDPILTLMMDPYIPKPEKKFRNNELSQVQ